VETAAPDRATAVHREQETTVAVTTRPRRLAHLAVAGLAVLTVAAVAGCSSSSGSKGSASTKRTGTPSSTVSSSTTTAPAPAPCTVAAISAVLPSGTRATGVVCAGGWAAGPDTNGSFDAAFLARADGSTWRILSASELQQACAPGNPSGIPAIVLAQSPCTVS
jgi:hypothetical protein